jgi:hypothetical protein
MEMLDERRIRLQPGERVTAESDVAAFNVSGTQALAAASALEFIAPRRPGVIVMQAHANMRGRITLTSNLGNGWTGIVAPGFNSFEFVVEPQPDVWYCENDDGNPPHPVSKGDDRCSFCGGRVRRGDE